MAVKSIGSFLDERGKRKIPFIEEGDVRGFIDRFCFERGLGRARCKEASVERVVITADTPAARMVAYLLEYELRGALDDTLGFSYKKLILTRS